MPLKVWSHVLLVGLSIALIVAFIVMRAKGAVYACEPNIIIWTGEMVAWVVMLAIGLFSLRQVCLDENERRRTGHDGR